MMAAVRKGRVVELATRQSQNAQAVTRALRAHGWRTRANGEPWPDGWQASQAREALMYAERIARDADAILSHVRAWAIQEGALNAGRG